MAEAKSRKLYSHLDDLRSAEEIDIGNAIKFLEMLNRKKQSARGDVYRGAVQSAFSCAEMSIKDSGVDVFISDIGITWKKRVPV